jgi:ABC-type polysaccharide/polyol phosphate export permease
LIIENVLNPLLTLFIFGVCFDSAFGEITLGRQTFPYLVFFLCGAVNLAMISNAIVGATKVFIDKLTGMHYEILTYPISRMSVVLGKLVFNVALTVLQTIVMIGFVELLYPGRLSRLIPFLFLTAFFSSIWFMMFSIVATIAKSQDAFNSFYYVVMTPMLLLSTIYYPSERLSGVLKVVIQLNPLTWTTDLTRVVLLDTSSTNLSAYVIALCALSVIVFFSNYLVTKRYSE